MYSFGLGQSPFPVPDSVVASLQECAAEKDYLPVQGLPELCKAVAEFHARVDGITYTPQQIMVGPGSKELLFIAQLCFAGDILIPAPSWVSYAPQAQIAGKQIIYLPTSFESKWLITSETLEKICLLQEVPNQPKLLILNYPSNPCGVSFSETELQKLVKVARRFNVLILSDEIYGLLHHQGNHVSIAKYYPEGTIVSTGLSKWCGAGGWRIGTFAFPKQLQGLLEAMVVVASETFTSVSAPIQYAAVTAFRGSDAIDAYLFNSRLILRVLGQWITSQFQSISINVRDVEGGFYVFPDFSFYKQKFEKQNIVNSLQLSYFLLDKLGVATLPGAMFGLAEEQLILRLSYVDFDGTAALSAITNGVEVDEKFLYTYCSKVVKGIHLITSWLTKLE